MAEMTGYWWECSCGNTTKSLPNEDGAIPSYIRTRIIGSAWNQKLLRQSCAQCGAADSMRITYEFPQNETGRVQVLHMVGLDAGDGSYVPMLWETFRVEDPRESMFEFNYIIGRNAWGLNRAAVLSLDDIHQLLELYAQKTGKPLPFAFVRAAHSSEHAH